MAPPAPHCQPIATRPSSSNRRMSTRSSVASSLNCSCSSTASSSSPAASDTSPSSPSTESTINSIIFRQPSIRGLEEERKSFPRGLNILEPRPIVYWSSVEERMGSMAPL
ncbi:hypothetical protein HRG_007810 [Hirsutella rhossiliensis]|uniref:Uncharacterized protein n=1 Tax=Hirsutella rhossiliensis TaxID=111463 RepID=A0A9P8MWW3_9HYPO|nr:uncharacterized protein HRG_07810 [Hirsutella rhossiliensis]KAH0960657.1 hypothetical protein HRG_07810 [Hirsutella rhossiliensis]